MSESARKDTPELAAWRALCRRMETMGERLLSADFPQAPLDRTEGFAHLAAQLVCWLGWANDYDDPRRPFFHRNNDLVTPWGGPNADNVYRHARIDRAYRYRIRGRMNACQDFVLTLRRGFMHEEKWGTLRELRASELGIREGREFEILLGGYGEPGWHAIPAEVRTASLREYYYDWRNGEPAVFTIDCLDAPRSLPRLTADGFAARMQRAATLVEESLEYYRKYMTEACAAYPDNVFSPVEHVVPYGKGATVGKGLSIARYGHCHWVLEPGQALLVECDAPKAGYWSFQLYTLAWFELADFRERLCGINHRQARIGADGRLRFAVSAEDPGCANWLDSGGRREGLLTYRCFWPEVEPATPGCRVVAIRDLRKLLPAGEPVVDAAARTEQINAWRRHLAWRFRT